MESILLGDSEFAVEIWSRGACVNDVRMPDRTGRIASILLGYAGEADRLRGNSYLGEICGPVANRIAAGGFAIDGQTFTPDLNDNGTATLHGGEHGWSAQDWSVTHADDHQATLHLDWSDPAGGFPGPVHADVEYRLHDWSLTHTVRATVEAPAVLNVVSHPYFNLSGSGAPITDHELTVPAAAYLPVDEACIPLSDAPWPVDGTPFDFRAPTPLAEALASTDPQMLLHGGLDHALILDGSGTRRAALLRHPDSGRELVILTDCPALQVYSGQYLTDQAIAHPAGAGGHMSGIALETEDFPDAPRRADFPSILIRPGQTYARTTTWQFRVN